MATHERPHIRPPALRHVLAARSSQNETDTTPRIFKVPLLNFEAQDYTELINLSSNKRADLPIFRSFQATQVEENIHTSDLLQLKSFPCHTQAVEMVTGQNGTVKMVWTKWYTDKMVRDKMVWTKWYGQNGTDKMLRIKSLINPTPIDNMIFFINPASTLMPVAFLYVLIIYL